MRPFLIPAFSEGSQDVAAPCQIVDANVTLQGWTVLVQTIYHKEDVVGVRHDQRREISPFWLAVLLEDVTSRSSWCKILKAESTTSVSNPDKWSTYVHCTYTGDTCNGNSPKCILTRDVGYTSHMVQILLYPQRRTPGSAGLQMVTWRYWRYWRCRRCRRYCSRTDREWKGSFASKVAWGDPIAGRQTTRFDIYLPKQSFQNDLNGSETARLSNW